LAKIRQIYSYLWLFSPNNFFLVVNMGLMVVTFYSVQYDFALIKSGERTILI